MYKIGISDLKLFQVEDSEKQQTYYGCDQAWYKTKWQQLSGCGPVTASHLYYYLRQQKEPWDEKTRFTLQEHWVTLMDEVWCFVTPSIRGVYTTKHFYEPLQAFALRHGLILDYKVCDIPENPEERPSLIHIIDFLSAALEKDLPVAFLNLCNGEECGLDRWHWVTIYSLEYSENKESAVAEIMDQGQIKRIDLALWLRSTTLGGGLVYFWHKA